MTKLKQKISLMLFEKENTLILLKFNGRVDLWMYTYREYIIDG